MSSTIFNSCSMVLAGSYAITYAKVIDIITANGGGHTATVDNATTTHLIVTQDTYNRNPAKVRAAKSAPNVKIVQYRWLTQSARDGVKLDETPFLLQPAPTKADEKRMLQSQSTSGAQGPPSKKRKLDAQQGPPSEKRKLDAQYLGHQVEVPLHRPGAFTDGTWKVWVDPDGLIFDAILRKVDVTRNENKFLHLQLVKKEDAPEWRTYRCGGRMGNDGVYALGDTGTVEEATASFEKVFKQKTGLNWGESTETARQGRYTFVERDYKNVGSAKPSNGDLDLPVSQADSALDPAVQRLMRLIFKKEYFVATLSKMGFDLKKVPLGNFSKESLNAGYECLKKLGNLMANTNARDREAKPYSDEVTGLTNAYYSIIPHAFGKNRPTLISSEEELKDELALVRNLGDAAIASKVREDAQATPGDLNILDKTFAALGIEMEPTEHKSQEFQEVRGYLLGTIGPTHNFNVSVEEIFRLERAGEAERFAEQYGGADPQLMSGARAHSSLLWHGSRVTNFAGILKEGLRVAPPEAPSTGYMFGKGIYFAAMSSKSGRYCKAKESDNLLLLLLCQVDLGGESLVLRKKNTRAKRDMEAKGMKSVFAKGLNFHENFKDAGCIREDLTGISMPDTSQPLIRKKILGRKLDYNEYIVYDPRQVRLKYLVLARKQ